MKKSEAVILTLVTGGVLFSLFHHNNVYRDRYASRADCERDWQNSSYCEPVPSGGYGGSVGTGGWGSRNRTDYYGPSYESGSRPNTAQRQLIAGNEVVKRSGFGHSGARFSGGG
ncbi:hypothetical protein [Pseudomonas sp. GV071]|uniref:hypothetical protein n=1 Tax=Pseudomonas sp. GV071 TaxID=2135754 RepID=UPI000D3BECA1|nr:hypothetical protein [Pseudomonas sp. GV071]PTQ69406.1 hypothetical protein C8K61_10851 [Pseudomonas sp. GV071]